MANFETVFVIYTYLSREELGLERKESEGPAHYILQVFEEHSLFPRDELVKLYNEVAPLKMPDLPEGYIGPFENLDVLNQFAFTFCDRHDASQVALVSIENYNEAINKINSSSDFNAILLEHSSVIANPDKDKRKGFFGKMFS